MPGRPSSFSGISYKTLGSGSLVLLLDYVPGEGTLRRKNTDIEAFRSVRYLYTYYLEAVTWGALLT